MSDDLEPIAPSHAVEMYLQHREPELSEKSLQNHKYRLDTFIEFCTDQGIEDMTQLTGRDIHAYRVWRSDEVAPLTLKTHLATLRVFLEFCATIDAVEQGFREKVVLPEVTPEQESRSVQLDQERADRLLEYLDRFHYASREHVIIALLWHTGIRLGTLRSLDLDDWDDDGLAFELRHRPESDTPLKNKKSAERTIAVGERYATILNDYIEFNRDDVQDEYSREPLITSNQGRLSAGAIRETVYKLTRPCVIGQDCPHDRDEDECEALEPDQASECPSSRSPHPIRRGAITRMLREGVPEEVVSDRANATPDVLEQHYDERSERERMEVRREFLTDV